MLRLFYVDESRDRGTNGHHYFVGLLADGDSIARAEAALASIAEKAWDDGLARWGTELHAAEIFNGTKAWQRGSIPQRISLLEATLEVIGDVGIEVIARGANMQRFAKNYPGADPYRWEFSNLLERLNERLRTLGDYGLVISDQQTEHREGIQRDVASSKQYGTGGYRSQKLERILDTAHFVDSKLSRMIQLADMAAFILSGSPRSYVKPRGVLGSEEPGTRMRGRRSWRGGRHRRVAVSRLVAHLCPSRRSRSVVR